ncbi:major facilitator superfamily domain-containing protein [Xylariales sp. PMI_506]|nr:major facilitator superfamily domain-containing protein [Xylariales sp. PMI_506]
MATGDEPTEASPLILESESTPPTQEQVCQAQDAGWTRDAIHTASWATAFLVLYGFADTLKYVPTVPLLELGVCREHYLERDPGVVDGVGNIPGDLCKSTEIQQRLAHLRAYMSTLEALVGLLLTLPYGLVVDRLGERLVAGINVVGYLLSCVWLIAVCSYWQTFPIWTAVLSPLFRVIGGGAPVASSVIYSIAAKHVPGSNRSLCFSIFVSAQLLTAVLSLLVTASLLDHGFLILPLILNFPLGILCVITLVMIHGGDSSAKPQPGSEVHREENAHKFSDTIRRSSHILTEILRDRKVLILLAVDPIAKCVNPISELMWQYIPKRFDLSFSVATRAISISSFEFLIILLVVQPIVRSIAQNKFHTTSARLDLNFIQFGFLMQGLGCLVLAFSQAFPVFLLGLMVYSSGWITKPALQSLLAGMVSRDHIAVLYIVMALGDSVGAAAGALVVNRVFAIVVGWDDNSYMGLPFFIGAILFLIGFAASMVVGSSWSSSRLQANK